MPLLILVIILSIIVALFAVQNAVTVSLNFVFWSFSASLVLVILGAFLMGVLVATGFLVAMKARHYLRDKKMQEQLKKLEIEKNKLEADRKRLEESLHALQQAQLPQENAAAAAKNSSSTQKK